MGENLLAYLCPLSNYTYCWYIDYRRFKGGLLGWFFTPYGGIRAGYAASEVMDYSTGKSNVDYWWL